MSQKQAYTYRENHTNAEGDEALQRPRRPNPETEARLRHGQPQTPASHQVNKNYTLSVNAQPFVPRFSGGNQDTQVNFSQPSHHLSVGATEFVPRADFSTAPPNLPPNMRPPLQMPPPPIQQNNLIDNFSRMGLYQAETNHFPGGGNRYTGANNYAGGSNPYSGGGGGQYTTGNQQYPDGMDQMTTYLLSEFSDTMMVLTTLPANIRDYLKPLCDKLRQASSPLILQKVIEILYQQSIYEPNFRYTGARVVHFLCNELKDHPIFGRFKPEFLRKCQEDYNRREQLLKGSPDDLNTLCGLTLFMGELFLNVTVGEDRLNFLPGIITDLVLTLVSSPSDTSIKTACQLLKLAGGPTEDTMSKNPDTLQNFNRMFTTLNTLQSSNILTKNIKLLMKSVIDLRENNWGRPESRQVQEPQQSSSLPLPEFVQSEPVFYNQYGTPITREEAGYPKEEEEEEDNLEDYELTEEEERDFLQWQEENATHEERIAAGPPNDGQGYGDGFFEQPYQQWSTNDGNYGYDYSQGYNYMYPGYVEAEGLTMDDEAEKAFEEFLSSQQGPRM